MTEPLTVLEAVRKSAGVDGWAKLHTSTFTQLCRVAKPTLRRRVLDLENRGYLKVKRNNQHAPNHYRLTAKAYKELPEEARHGTDAEYKRGCRCSFCGEAHRLAMREERSGKRRKTLTDCLLSSDLPTPEIEGALEVHSEYVVHWALWRKSGLLREHCTCEAPRDVLGSLEEAS